MSQENVELVRRVYEGWARGDFSMIEAFHPEIVFEMVDWPHQTKVRGIAAMSATWRETLRAWDDFRSVPTEYIDCGRNILVLNRIEGSGKESGADVSADTATVWTVEDGLVTRMALYWDVDRARQAAEGGPWPSS
jgi:ketosteroid isomerase-like protein